MKKSNFLLCVILFAAQSAFSDAQPEYIPFVEDGKVFKYDRIALHQSGGGQDVYHREFVMSGTKVIDGKTYASCFDHEEKTDLGDAVAFVREDDGKIYVRGPYLEQSLYEFYDPDKEYLYYDRNNPKSSEHILNTFNPEFNYLDMWFCTDEFVIAEDRMRRQVRFDFGSEWNYYPFWLFVEGIGFVFEPNEHLDLFFPELDCLCTNPEFDRLRRVEDKDGNLLYDYAKSRDYPTIPLGVSEVSIDEIEDVAEWFDLRGVRLTSKPTTAGIYIVRYTDGTAKKVVVK